MSVVHHQATTMNKCRRLACRAVKTSSSRSRRSPMLLLSSFIRPLLSAVPCVVLFSVCLPLAVAIIHPCRSRTHSIPPFIRSHCIFLHLPAVAQFAARRFCCSHRWRRQLGGCCSVGNQLGNEQKACQLNKAGIPMYNLQLLLQISLLRWETNKEVEGETQSGKECNQARMGGRQ